MAQRGRPRKVLSEELETAGDSSKSSEDKNRLLLSEIDELKRQLAILVKEKEHSTDTVMDDVDARLRPDTYVTIVSLCPYTLNLSTKPRGTGTTYTFRAFGEKKRILYSDLVLIMENHREHTDFLREGFFYIENKDVIRRHGLDDAYEKILTKEKIEQLLSTNDIDIAVSLFSNATDSQRGMVSDILVGKMINGERVDLNLIDALSKIIKRDLQAIAKEASVYLTEKK